MIKRIDLFMPPKGVYQALHEFTTQFSKAFNRIGITSRILESQRDNPKAFLEPLQSNPPDFTLSFNGLLPDASGNFLCDLIEIPHVACLVDAPQLFLSLTQSPYTIITTIDKDFSAYFKAMQAPNVLFMPLAVDKELVEEKLTEDRPYDILMAASFLGDHEEIRNSWKEKYHRSLNAALDEAIEITFGTNVNYIQALTTALDRRFHTTDFNLENVNMLLVLDELERYLKGKDRVELMKSIKDASLHLVGNDVTKWKKYLGKNVIYHEPVPYPEVIQMMKKSKIVLNSSVGIKNGAHDRIFIGFGAGACVLTDENPYLKEQFGEDILFYRPSKWESVNSLINEYLSNGEKRYSLIHKAREKILKNHTWDQRAKHLIQQL